VTGRKNCLAGPCVDLPQRIRKLVDGCRLDPKTQMRHGSSVSAVVFFEFDLNHCVAGAIKTVKP
jgi:hypothetical protein